jgi:uncharacterized protein (DUF2461 family)
MTKQEQLEVIFNSLINGQRRQMVEQIDEYLPADFFPDLLDFLRELFPDSALYYFADATNSYFRIKENKCQ